MVIYVVARLRSTRSGQIAGTSSDCVTARSAVLWEKGTAMGLEPYSVPAPILRLIRAWYINDRGEIAAEGLLPNGDEHAALLIPNGDCDGDCEGRINASQNGAAPAQYPATMKRDNESRLTPIERIRSITRQRYHMRSQPAAPEY